MKRFAAVLLTGLVVMSLAACGRSGRPEDADTPETP